MMHFTQHQRFAYHVVSRFHQSRPQHQYLISLIKDEAEWAVEPWKKVNYFNLSIIGASLSKPHTSTTALRMNVCMLVMKHVKASGRLLSECSVDNSEQRRLKLKHARQLNSALCFYQLSTAVRSQAVQFY